MYVCMYNIRDLSCVHTMFVFVVGLVKFQVFRVCMFVVCVMNGGGGGCEFGCSCGVIHSLKVRK